MSTTWNGSSTPWSTLTNLLNFFSFSISAPCIRLLSLFPQVCRLFAHARIVFASSIASPALAGEREREREKKKRVPERIASYTRSFMQRIKVSATCVDCTNIFSQLFLQYNCSSGRIVPLGCALVEQSLYR